MCQSQNSSRNGSAAGTKSWHDIRALVSDSLRIVMFLEVPFNACALVSLKGPGPGKTRRTSAHSAAANRRKWSRASSKLSPLTIFLWHASPDCDAATSPCSTPQKTSSNGSHSPVNSISLGSRQQLTHDPTRTHAPHHVHHETSHVLTNRLYVRAYVALIRYI